MLQAAAKRNQFIVTYDAFLHHPNSHGNQENVHTKAQVTEVQTLVKF